MAVLSLTWPDIVKDLDNVETVTPVIGYPTRERWSGSQVQAYLEPGSRDGERVYVVVGLRKRHRSTDTAMPVVGVETRVRGPRTARGRALSRWPRTWRELFEQLQAMDDVRLEQGRKHVRVYLHGSPVTALPNTPSEYRGLLNACMDLRAKGIDVRQPGNSKRGSEPPGPTASLGSPCGL